MVSGTAVYNAKGNRYDWLTQTLHASIFTTECNSGPINSCVHSSLAFKVSVMKYFYCRKQNIPIFVPSIFMDFLNTVLSYCEHCLLQAGDDLAELTPMKSSQETGHGNMERRLSFQEWTRPGIKNFFYQFCSSAAILMPFCFLIQHCFNSLKHFNIPVLKCCRPGHCFDWLRFVKSHG